MPEFNRDDPRDVILAFAIAFTQWENEMHFATGGANEQSLKQRRDEIIHDYCTQKKRAYIDGVYSYQRPPVYQQVIAENIVNVEATTRTKTYIDTKKLHTHAYRFVLVKKRDGWRLDSVKWRFSENAEWESTFIGT